MIPALSETSTNLWAWLLGPAIRTIIVAIPVTKLEAMDFLIADKCYAFLLIPGKEKSTNHRKYRDALTRATTSHRGNSQLQRVTGTMKNLCQGDNPKKTCPPPLAPIRP